MVATLLSLTCLINYGHAQSQVSDKQVASKDFFREYFLKYSDALDLEYSQEKGIHAVAMRELKPNEPVMQIPAQLVISNCKW